MRNLFSKKTGLLLLAILMFIPLISFAQDTAGQNGTLSDALVVALGPLITLAVTWLFGKINGVTGTMKLLIVTLLSAGLPYLTEYLSGVDGSWVVLFLANTASTFFHQLWKKFS